MKRVPKWLQTLSWWPSLWPGDAKGELDLGHFGSGYGLLPDGIDDIIESVLGAISQGPINVSHNKCSEIKLLEMFPAAVSDMVDDMQDHKYFARYISEKVLWVYYFDWCPIRMYFSINWQYCIICNYNARYMLAPHPYTVGARHYALQYNTIRNAAWQSATQITQRPYKEHVLYISHKEITDLKVCRVLVVQEKLFWYLKVLLTTKKKRICQQLQDCWIPIHYRIVPQGIAQVRPISCSNNSIGRHRSHCRSREHHTNTKTYPALL